jgi:RNA polymerase sigma-70 factor (ECF subfamily)
MTQSDKECVQLSLNGHAEAFGGLVERYWAPLLSYLAGRLGDREWAEEAVQESFVRSLVGLKSLRKPESFFSWLFGIADRVVKEQRRSRWLHADPTAVPSRKPVVAEPSNDYDLERAVAGLSEAYRQVILLRYYGGLSCAEVAERLSLPLGTVTKRLSRAYAMLRESLESVDVPQRGPEVRR